MGYLDYTPVVEILRIIDNEFKKGPFLRSLVIDVTRK